MNQYSNPLVSIIVITYNSEKYVLETLESAKSQTYQNIELIVSDDASMDDTVAICNDWLEKNKDRFVRTELITVKKNSGIPANCNRGVKASKGDWIKLIAGDDTLKNSALDDFIKHIRHNPEIVVLVTQVDVYMNQLNSEMYLGTKPDLTSNLDIYNESIKCSDQIEFILRGGYHQTPALFVHKKVLKIVNYYDEEFRLLEDVPFYLKLGLNGFKIHFLRKATVNYRKSELGLTMSNSNYALPRYMLDYSRSLIKYAKIYGRKRFLINSYHNLIMVKAVFLIGNKGRMAMILNMTRMNIQPIRFFNLFDKVKLNFSLS